MKKQNNITAAQKAHNANMKKVVTLANNLVALGWNRSDAMKEAHSRVAEMANMQVVKWEKKDGTQATRVIAENWFDYVTVKGSGRNAIHWVVADFSKVVDSQVVAGKKSYYSPVISIIRENIKAA